MSKNEKIKDENKKLLNTVTNLFSFNILFFILGFALSFLFFDILATKIKFVNEQIFSLNLKIDTLKDQVENLEHKIRHQAEIDMFNEKIDRVGKEYQRLKAQDNQ